MQRHKRSILVGSICLVLLLVAMPLMVACAKEEPAPTPAQPITINALVELPTDWPSVAFMGTYRDMVNERSQGRLIIDWRGGPEVIGEYDQAEACRTGAIDMVLNSTVSFRPLVPEGEAMWLSKLTPMEERESGFYDLMLQLYKERANVYYLGRAARCEHALFVNKKITRPQDLRGMTLAGFPYVEPFYKEVGIILSTIDIVDFYTALDRGLIEGFALPPSDTAEMGFAEVCKYMIDYPWFGPCNLIFVINLDKWNTIPEDLQDLMLEVAIEIEQQLAAFYQEHYLGGRAKLVEQGMELIRFSDADAEWYIDAFHQGLWKLIYEDVGTDMVNQLKSLLGY